MSEIEITIEVIKAILIFVILSLGYGVIRFAKERQAAGESWDWYKFAPTAIFSVALGFIMVLTGTVSLANLSDLLSIDSIMSGLWVQYFTLFTVILYIWENVVVPFIKNLLTRVEKNPAKFVFPTTVDPLRQMDPETRKWLVSDQREPYKDLILKAVDAAQEQKVIRYAISAGAWEFLIEFGIVTGGKHYLWKGWFGNGVVLWKAISSACLEQIRATGKWPDYSKLY